MNESPMNERRRSRAPLDLVAALVLGITLLATAVAGAGCQKTLPRPASPASCGDRCAAMNCPAGTTCSTDARCTARCDPQPLPIP